MPHRAESQISGTLCSVQAGDVIDAPGSLKKALEWRIVEDAAAAVQTDKRLSRVVMKECTVWHGGITVRRRSREASPRWH